MWTKHSANVKRSGSGSKTKSEYSSYARTVVGNSHPLDSPNDNHAAFCNGCNQLSVNSNGIQSGNISPLRFPKYCTQNHVFLAQCANCEKSSYILHDPNHIYFKLKRPVSRPIESAYPMVPKLYKTPAGPLDGNPNPEDLNGVWYRCVYCGKDLCDECEAVDTHNDTHFFLVFKSPDICGVGEPTWQSTGFIMSFDELLCIQCNTSINVLELDDLLDLYDVHPFIVLPPIIIPTHLFMIPYDPVGTYLGAQYDSWLGGLIGIT
ncbi:hypothetical protein MPER_10621 [Moniliophthora perniciosa FA553]|nr:hypothetical protein MPER_10621 [Moniliophthora perniciosa FA553]